VSSGTPGIGGVFIMPKTRLKFSTVFLTGLLIVFFSFGSSAVSQAEELTEAEYIKAMTEALQAIIKRHRPKAPNKLVFRANLFFAHETAIKNMPLDILKAKVLALKEAGVKGVDINMGLYPWLDRDMEAIQKYDALIEFIRAQGLTLALNPAYAYVYHRVDNFKDFEEKAEKAWLMMADRYKPDIFVVAHEPSTQSMRMGFETGPRVWADFVKRMARKVKMASPGSRIGAGVHSGEERYFAEFVKIEELESISFDIYTVKGLVAVNRMIPKAKKAGKAVYIEETWRPPYVGSEAGLDLDYKMARGVGLERFARIDCLWLEMITIYASIWGLEAVTPFWTQAFFWYDRERGDALDQGYNLKVIEAIALKKRTSTYGKFSDLIKEYGK